MQALRRIELALQSTDWKDEEELSAPAKGLMKEVKIFKKKQTPFWLKNKSISKINSEPEFRM